MSETTSNRPLLFALKLAVFIPVIAAIITATYFSIDAPGRLPDMPGSLLSPQEEQRAIDGLEKRAEGFTPSPDDQVVIEQLEAMNLTESGEPPLPLNLAHLIDATKKSLGELADRDEQRFFRLGDLLALRFHHSLRRLLEDRTASDRTVALRINQVRRHGGAFYNRALERGVITPEGRLAVSSVTPEVLFRYRWRHLGGRGLTQGFSESEKRALYDFMVRFGAKDDEARRLEAVKQLKQLDKHFDAVIAEALIHYQAGTPDAALGTLEAAAAAGRRDETLSGFIRLLRQ